MGYDCFGIPGEIMTIASDLVLQNEQLRGRLRWIDVSILRSTMMFGYCGYLLTVQAIQEETWNSNSSHVIIVHYQVVLFDALETLPVWNYF